LAQAVERQQLIDTRARGMNPAQARGSVDYRVRKAGCQQKVDIVQRLREALAIPAEGHFHVVGKLRVPVSREVPRHGVEVKRGLLAPLALQIQSIEHGSRLPHSGNATSAS
jgi:hypothetical protein